MEAVLRSPQGLLSARLNSPKSQPVFAGVCCSPVIYFMALLSPAKVPLSVIPFQQLVNHTTQLGAVSNIAEVLSIPMSMSLPELKKMLVAILYPEESHCCHLS